MARASLDYTASARATGQGFNPDLPIAGYYRTQLRSGAVFVGIRIWHGPPLDPVTREELDRSWRWNALANDRDIDLDRVWPKCADSPIDAAEYAYLTSLEAWGREHAPNSPQANPNQPINLMTAPPPF